MAKVIEFDAPLISPEASPNSGVVEFPFDMMEIFGRKSVKAKFTYNGIPYRGLLKSMGGDCVYCLIRKDIREQLGKELGELIHVTVEEDTEERVVEVPAELQEKLDAAPAARAFFEKLSYTCKKEYVAWITSAKREETRQNRLEKTIGYLLKGKRNPS